MAGPASPLAVTAGIMIGVYLLLQAVLAVLHCFDPDEWLTLHGAWTMAQGMVPYRDYFEHHGPLFHGVLSVICWADHPEQSFAAAYAVIVGTRLWMVAFFGLALALTWRLAERWRGPQVAWVATALLACHVTYSEKMLEVRPDVLFQVLWLGALVALTRALTDPEHRWSWRIAGLCLGAALATSVKLLVTGPALCIGLAIGFWPALRGPGRMTVLRGLVALVAGALVPLALVALWFAWHHALHLAWTYNFARNLGWRFNSSPWEYAGWVLIRNLAFAGLAVAGLLGLRRDRKSPLDWPLWCWAVGTAAGVFAMPVVQRQEYLLFLPLLALFAGEALVTLVADFKPLTARHRDAALIGGAVAVAAVMLWGLDPYRFFTRVPETQAYHAFGVFWQVLTLGLAALIAATRWRRSVAACLLVLMLNPLHVLWVSRLSTRGNEIDRIEKVMTVTSPTDTVLDGWSGLGVFRPHAQRYFFLHPEIRALLGEPYRQQMEADVRSGALAPKVAILDLDLVSVSPGMSNALRRWYRPIDASDGIIRLRRPHPLPELALGTWPANGAQTMAKAALDRLWRQPETQAALVVTPTILSGVGTRVDLTWAPNDPLVMATLQRTIAGWNLETWFCGGLYCERDEGTIAWRRGDQWHVEALQGRQGPDGSWVMRTALEPGAPLPPYILYRPRGWPEWFIVGLPVRLEAMGRGVPAVVDGEWHMWPRQANGVPHSLQMPTGLSAGSVMAVTSWFPFDMSALPVDLPGSQSSSAWDAGNVWRKPKPGFGYGLNAVEVFATVMPGQVVHANPQWKPELVQILPP